MRRNGGGISDEADKPSDQMMKMQSEKAITPPVQQRALERSSGLERTCGCGTHALAAECEACGTKRLQRRAAGQSHVHEAVTEPEAPNSSGHAKTRAFFEARFAHDFSEVRVHPDLHASKTAGSVNTFSQPAVNRSMTGEPGSDVNTPSLPAEPEDAVPTSGELPGNPGACVVQAAMPSNRSGIIRTPTGSVYENFEVHVEWSSSKYRGPNSYCAAECGEYHQFVKGYARSSPNQDGSGLNDVSAKVFGGKALDQNVFQEDGLDSNPAARYGHRKEKQTMNENYEPDRATGPKYVGKDAPGVHIGTFADFDLTFLGKLVDTCQNTEVVSEPWRVAYRGVIRP
ncbi:MAG TPA: DUF4157 domain-containing protein [Pyrinomonadaceae bacterium]